MSVNRAAIFLRPPFAESDGVGGAGGQPADLRAACAIGLSPGLLEHFELSFDTGIGGQLFRLGRILRRHSDEVRADVEAQKEFELLGGQVAVPILDRERLLGVAVFDGRVTGEPLVNAELELIFHLLEQVGLALRNIWLHDQLAGNHEMMAGVLRELNSACVVVSRDLKVLHANKMARQYFGPTTGRSGETGVHRPAAGPRRESLPGAAHRRRPWRRSSTSREGSPGTVYNVTIVPFQRQDSGAARLGAARWSTT